MINIENSYICDCNLPMQSFSTEEKEACFCPCCSKIEFIKEDDFKFSTQILKTETIQFGDTEQDKFSSCFTFSISAKNQLELFAFFFRNYDLSFAYSEKIKYTFSDKTIENSYALWLKNFENSFKSNFQEN